MTHRIWKFNTPASYNQQLMTYKFLAQIRISAKWTTNLQEIQNNKIEVEHTLKNAQSNQPHVVA